MDKKRILVVGLKRGTNKKIARDLGVTSVMVSMALCGRKNTLLARKIRHIATKVYGGQQVELKESVQNGTDCWEN